MRKITEIDCLNYAKCKYRVFRDMNDDISSQSVIDPFLALLWDGSVPGKKDVIERFKNESKKEFVDIVVTDEDKVFKETLAHMESGVECIVGGILELPGEDTLFAQQPAFGAEPDILMRMNGKSKFGDFLYVPVYVKLGSGLDETDWGDRPSQAYSAQLNLTVTILESLLTSHIDSGYILNTKGMLVRYSINTKDSKFKEILTKIGRYVNAELGTAEPVIGGLCGLCPWQESCLEKAKSEDNLTLLFYLGEKVRDGLYFLGVKNIKDLAESDAKILLPKVQDAKYKGYFYKSVTDSLVRSLILRAKLYIERKNDDSEIINKMRSAPHFPEVDKEIHYDIEDDPIFGEVYMHGFWIIEKGKDSYYHDITMRDGKTEEEVTKELWRFFQDNENVPIYHYSGHEKKTCAKLMKKYYLDTKVFESVFGTDGSAIDLYEWVLANTDWALTSYGLKPICKYTGFSWSAEDAGGANSISWYDEYKKGNVSKMEKILIYNKEDCMATAHLKEWLVKNG